MTAFNLIPSPHLAKHHERTVRRWWIAGVAACVLTSAILTAIVITTAPADTDRTTERIAEAATRADAATKKATRWRVEAARSARELTARRAVGEHPDWSLLLARLASQRGDSIVLETCDVSASVIFAPVVKAGEDASPPVRRYTITVAGLGPTQSHVLQYVSAIEGWRVFDKVTLEESRARTIGTQEGHSFRLRMTLDEGGRR
ncbi:hypothetical protein D4Q85_00010 [bacterium]|nr:MAG: hypothetical protein D4Q85_00010 [bacterium]